MLKKEKNFTKAHPGLFILILALVNVNLNGDLKLEMSWYMWQNSILPFFSVLSFFFELPIIIVSLFFYLIRATGQSLRRHSAVHLVTSLLGKNSEELQLKVGTFTSTTAGSS